MRILNLGCGRRDIRAMFPPEAEYITLDRDARLEPDLVCTLGEDRIPLANDSVDIAVAIHVLEHIGAQGETRSWFYFWEELYRVMAPDGRLQFESPLYSSVWAWADPSHTRALSPESFIFFYQENYRIDGSSISPFRIACDFVPAGPFVMVRAEPNLVGREAITNFRGELRAIKPLRPWWKDEPRISPEAALVTLTEAV